MTYPGYLRLGETEIINNQRAFEHARHGVCSRSLELLDDPSWQQTHVWLGEDRPVTPAETGAPWHDPGDPASEEFGGVYATSIGNLATTEIEQEITEGTGDGGSALARRFPTRVMPVECALRLLLPGPPVRPPVADTVSPLRGVRRRLGASGHAVPRVVPGAPAVGATGGHDGARRPRHPTVDPRAGHVRPGGLGVDRQQYAPGRRWRLHRPRRVRVDGTRPPYLAVSGRPPGTSGAAVRRADQYPLPGTRPGRVLPGK